MADGAGSSKRSKQFYDGTGRFCDAQVAKICEEAGEVSAPALTTEWESGILFAVLGAMEYVGWWATVKSVPDGACVIRFLNSFGWMGVGAPVVLAASSAFLNTVILAKVFEMFRRS